MTKAEIELFLLLILFAIALSAVAYDVSQMWRSHRRKNTQTARADPNRNSIRQIVAVQQAVVRS
jgi:hypothetical protein